MSHERNLVQGVELLCLDAGNTIVFFDAVAASEAVAHTGVQIAPEAWIRAEADVKRRLEPGQVPLAPPLSDPEIPAPWSAFMRTWIEVASGMDRTRSAACVRAAWVEHSRLNLWRRVPEGLPSAVRALRRTGIPVCVVSNSEGRLDALFRTLGLADLFDHVLDSHHVGVEKPDPRIFEMALTRFGVPPDAALHLGDTVGTDVVGARRAGIRAALIDPDDLYAGRHLDVPRVAGVASIAEALVAEHTRATGD